MTITLKATNLKVFKFSAELLSQRKIKDQLVKQKKFSEADKVHAETLSREANERLKFEEDRQIEIDNKLTN